MMKKLTLSLIGFAFLLFAISANAAGLGEDCTVDADCNDSVYCNGIESCSLEGSVCVEGIPVDCGDQICDEEAGACVECQEDLDCADNGTPFCSETLECVECLEDFDCADEEICQLGECIEQGSCDLFIRPPILKLKKGVKPVKQMFTIKGVKGEEGFNPDTTEIDFGPCEILRTFVAGDSDVLKVEIMVPDNTTFEGDFLDVQVGDCTGQVFIKNPGNKHVLKELRKQEKLALKEQRKLEQQEKKAAKKAAKEAKKNK